MRRAPPALAHPHPGGGGLLPPSLPSMPGFAPAVGEVDDGEPRQNRSKILHHNFWLASKKEIILWYLCVGRIWEDMADQVIQLEARCLFSEMHACGILLFLFIKFITELIIKTLSGANYQKQLSVILSSICGKYISSLFKNQERQTLFFFYIF